MTSTWKLFCRTMRVMGKRRFLYYGAILGMSAGKAMFSVLGSLLMKSVVDISQSRDYSSLGVTGGRQWSTMWRQSACTESCMSGY